MPGSPLAKPFNALGRGDVSTSNVLIDRAPGPSARRRGGEDDLDL